MKLSLRDLAKVLPTSEVVGDVSLCVTGVSLNSSKIAPGELFVAISGAKSNGHLYVEDAFKRGAAAAVVAHGEVLNGRPGIIVPDTRVALSRLAAHFCGDAAKKLITVLITGTNGKTTVHWLTSRLLKNLGIPTIRIGTIGVFAEGLFDLPGELTTPDPVSIHSLLSRSHKGGVNAAVLEASSHALDQHRIDDLEPNVAVLTNLTRDHLDYHPDMESYYLAKKRLFELLKQSSKEKRGGVINLDDAYGARLLSEIGNCGCELISFGFSPGAALKIEQFVEHGPDGATLNLSFKRERVTLLTPLIGKHNASNLAATAAVALALGYSLADACQALSGVEAAPGRLQYVAGRDFGVYVDYAHSPDALERVLEALKPITRGKLWVLFGCGGDRDKGKRPEMGKIAARLADRVVVTSDNPRTEDAKQIITDILSCGIKPYAVEADRKKAIEQAVQGAQPGDVILIAGKGHVDYQIIGKEKFHFSDVEVATAAMAKLGR